MNSNKKVAKNYERKMAHIMKRRLDGLKNIEYASVYSVIALWETLILALLEGFCKWEGRIIIEFISIVIMLFLTHYAINDVRIKCENSKNNKYTQSVSKWSNIATDAGYLSPIICIVGWAITLNGMDTECKLITALAMVILYIVLFYQTLKKMDTKENR